MKRIHIKNSFYAIVDDIDYQTIIQYKWFLHPVRCSHGAAKYYVRGYKIGVKYSGKHMIYMHHLVSGKKKGFQTDHLNGDRLDNRRLNLRFATQSQNNCNQHVLRKGTSKYRGVFWCKAKRRWIAKIKYNGTRHYAGTFTDETEAAKAYDKLASQIAVAFACTNF